MYKVIRASELERGLPTLLRQFESSAAHINEVSVEQQESARPEQPESVDTESKPALQTGRDRLEERYEAGYRAGFEAGAQEGKRAVAESVSEELEQHRHRVAGLTESMEEALSVSRGFQAWAEAEYRGEALELALVIAERVVREQLHGTPRLLVAMMDEILRNEESPTLQEIRVSSEDRDQVLEHLDPLRKYADDGAVPRVLADPEVVGGFILITDRGGIDARISTQIGRLGEQLRKGMQDDDAI